MKTQQNRRFFP